MANKLKLTVLSFSCCNPQFAAHDARYMKLIKDVLEKTGIEADIELVTVTEAMMSLTYAYMAPIRPLFQKYGSAVAPALFINETLALFGGVPTEEKLIEVLKKASQTDI
ncbi:MAG: thioredoxin family protein [Methanomassiliicoccales archaeon]|nr:MAG: thioredoxin family protein [Methanomassiliicoccales archaeon]